MYYPPYFPQAYPGPGQFQAPFAVGEGRFYGGSHFPLLECWGEFTGSIFTSWDSIGVRAIIIPFMWESTELRTVI